MNSQKQQFSELLEAIKERNGIPVNVHVVSATIESMGIRDADTQEDYGYDSIHNLATSIYGLLRTAPYIGLKNKNQLVEEKKEEKIIYLSGYSGIRKKLFLKEYSTGILHLFPIFIQIIAIVLFGFSLWTSMGFNDLQSTAVVMGVIMGFVFAGGFVQSIGKQVSFYWYNHDYGMAQNSMIQLLKKGTRTMLSTFVLLACINFFLHFYPFLFVGIVFMYSFLIGLLLLSLAPLYIIKRRWVLSASITMATAVALLLHFYSSLHVYFVHWIGISVAIALSLGYLLFCFKKNSKKKDEVANTPPKIMLSVYRNFNYFFYGILLYAFLFTDRILAYSSTLNRNIPYIIYYDKDYEIGMDLAILVFFLLAGVMEYSIVSFSRFIGYYQRTLRYHDVEGFNKKMKHLYVHHIQVFLGSSVGIGILLYFMLTQPWGYHAAFHASLSALSLKVFIIGSFGYLFLSFGILNVLYLFTLNRHRKPVNLLLIAFGVNLIVGTLLSRMVGYEYSSIGLLLGALVFMGLTTQRTLRYFNHLDYYYYAAY